MEYDSKRFNRVRYIIISVGLCQAFAIGSRAIKLPTTRDTLMSRQARKPDNSLKLEGFLCFAVYAAGHAFNRVYKPLLDKLGLTYPQYLLMVALWEQDDQTVGALGQKMYLESSTLTPLIKRLESLGLLARTRDPRDERQVRVRLTARGKALREGALEIPPCILDASGLKPEDLRRLTSEISALRNALESYKSGTTTT
jgi:DNA-binding MarR family transcriptional regulator